MYSISYHESVKGDLKKLGHRAMLLVLNKVYKIAQNPAIGKDLGNKANLNLVGYKKIYVDNKKIRIVYKIINKKIEVFVIAVGKRDDMSVYKKANSRV